MNHKDNNFKERLKRALDSTARVISNDLKDKKILEKNKSSKKFDFFDLENLNSKNDFIKARAESDSLALKKKFSNNDVLKKNQPLSKRLMLCHLVNFINPHHLEW